MPKRKTHEEFVRDIKKINPNIEILGKYKNLKVKIKCQCKTCKHIWEAFSTNLMKGKGCPKCAAKKRGLNKRKTLDLFILEAQKVHGNKYNYDKVKYTGAHDKVCIICSKHGEFWQSPINHTKGCGCPRCNYSHGEELIYNYLILYGLNFITLFEVLLPKIARKTNIVYIDFCVIKDDTKYFIEYNGKKHYVPIEHFGGEIKLKELKNRDNLVRSYCKDNDIKLLELSYELSDNELLNQLKVFVNE